MPVGQAVLCTPVVPTKRRARSARPTRAIRAPRGCAALHKRLKNEEAEHDGLEEKENCVKLMIALVSRDRSSNQACEIKRRR